MSGKSTPISLDPAHINNRSSLVSVGSYPIPLLKSDGSNYIIWKNAVANYVRTTRGSSVLVTESRPECVVEYEKLRNAITTLIKLNTEYKNIVTPSQVPIKERKSLAEYLIKFEIIDDESRMSTVFGDDDTMYKYVKQLLEEVRQSYYELANTYKQVTKNQIYGTILSLLEPSLLHTVQNHIEFKTIENNTDELALWKLVRSICRASTASGEYAIINAKKNLDTFEYNQSMTPMEFVREYAERVETLFNAGYKPNDEEQMVKDFFARLDSSMAEFVRKYMTGERQWPTTFDAALNLIKRELEARAETKRMLQQRQQQQQSQATTMFTSRNKQQYGNQSRGTNNNNNGKYNNNRNGNDFSCSYCRNGNTDGHTTPNCGRLKAFLRYNRGTVVELLRDNNSNKNQFAGNLSHQNNSSKSSANNSSNNYSNNKRQQPAIKARPKSGNVKFANLASSFNDESELQLMEEDNIGNAITDYFDDTEIPLSHSSYDENPTDDNYDVEDDNNTFVEYDPFSAFASQMEFSEESNNASYMIVSCANQAKQEISSTAISFESLSNKNDNITVGLIDKDTTILDNGSSVHIVTDPKHLTDIQEIDPPFVIKGIGSGQVIVRTKGTFSVFGEAFYVPNQPVNLLSQSKLEDDGFKLYYSNGEFTIQTTIGVLSFVRQGPFYVLKDQYGQKFSVNRESILSYQTSTMKTVHKHKKPPDPTPRPPIPRSESKLDEYANLFRLLHETKAHISDQRLILEIEKGVIKDCPIPPNMATLAAKRSLEIHGPCIGCKLGKMIKAPEPPANIPPPTSIAEVIHADIFFLAVNTDKATTPFLLTTSRLGYMVHCIKLKSKTAQALFEAVLSVINWYIPFGHRPKMIRTDKERVFVCLKSILGRYGITLTHSSPGKHEKHAERDIRLIKEHLFSLTKALLYDLPRFLLPFALDFVVNAINSTIRGSMDKSPLEITTGVKLSFSQLTKCKFGDFVAFLDDSAQSSRSSIGIYLGRDTTTTNGSQLYVLIDNSNSGRTIGKVITRDQFDLLSPTQELIKLVNEIARKQPFVPDDQLFLLDEIYTPSGTITPSMIEPPDNNPMTDDTITVPSTPPTIPTTISTTIPPTFNPIPNSTTTLPSIPHQLPASQPNPTSPLLPPSPNIATPPLPPTSVNHQPPAYLPAINDPDPIAIPQADPPLPPIITTSPPQPAVPPAPPPSQHRGDTVASSKSTVQEFINFSNFTRYKCKRE